MVTAVALLSGGLDSGVALAAWLHGGDRVVQCLTFDYGQRSAAREAASASALAGRFTLPWTRVALPWLGEVAARAGSALIAQSGARPPEGTATSPGDATSAAAVWVPARNALFVTAAAAWAEALDAEAILVGFNREEAVTFPDNSAAFLGAADALLRLGTRRGVTLASPTLELDKRGIAAAARSLGLGPEDFWSCYLGGDAPCGRCESCLRSARAWGSTPSSGP